MSERNRPGRGPTDATIDRDLEALRARSRRDVEPLEDTLATLSGRGRRSTWEERPMTSFWTRRPRLVMAVAAAAVALALLLVPVSYERVTGHRVSVTLAGAPIERPVMDEIAAGLKAALGADEVGVASRAGEAGQEVTLSAELADGDGGNAEAVAAAFVRTLEAKGYRARAEVTPIRERTSGNVYAMVLDNVIRVSMDGKSADELEAEIAQQLAAAGVPNAEVSVTLDGDDMVEIQVKAEAEGEPGEIVTGEPTRIVLTRNGEDLGGELEEVGVRVRMLADGGAETMNVEVDRSGRSAVAVIENPKALSDAELAAEIDRQLAEQGLAGLSVSVSGGQVEILVADPEAGVQGTAEDEAERKATWGEVKRKYDESSN